MGAQGDRHHLRAACTRTVGVMAGFVPRRLCGSVASVTHKRRRLSWSRWSRMSPNLLMRGVALSFASWRMRKFSTNAIIVSFSAGADSAIISAIAVKALPSTSRASSPLGGIARVIVTEQLETRQIALQNLGSTGNLSICSNICSMACRLYVPAASLASIGDALRQFDSRQIQVTGARLT